MTYSARTDLAAEAHAAWKTEKTHGETKGLRLHHELRQGIPVELLEIEDRAAAETLGKRMGRYATLRFEALHRGDAEFARTVEVLADELRTQLPIGTAGPVLVMCLGNADITPDALGPLTAEYVIPTRHLVQSLPEQFGAFRSVSVLRSGVLGTTGIESAALARSVCALCAPCAVIAVDALCAAEADCLCRTVQVTDAGIVPGSGVGNARDALDRETLGVPVIAIGVPTVVDAKTLCHGEATESMFVTPRSIDRQVRECARLVGYAIDLALHPGLTLEDAEAFTA